MTTRTVPWTGSAVPILPTADIPRIVEFYERLGFTTGVFRDGGYAYLTSSGTQYEGVILHYQLVDGLDPFVSAGMAYVTVDDVDGVYEAVAAIGVAAPAFGEDGLAVHSTSELRGRWRQGLSLARISKPWDQPWGMREFALIDPDNNLLRVGSFL